MIFKPLLINSSFKEKEQKNDKKGLNIKPTKTTVVAKENVKIKSTEPKITVKKSVIESNNKPVVSEGNVKTIFDHKNMIIKVIKKPTTREKNTIKSKNKDSNQKK